LELERIPGAFAASASRFPKLPTLGGGGGEITLQAAQHLVLPNTSKTYFFKISLIFFSSWFMIVLAYIFSIKCFRVFFRTGIPVNSQLYKLI